MTKIDALNSLSITDYSCGGGELEYVLADNNEANRTVLLNAGFTEEQIKEASDDTDSDIDLSYLAFNYTKANWWKVDGGFGIEDTSKYQGGSNMKDVFEKNGFVIREKEEDEMSVIDDRRYVVYHRNFDGVFIADFKTLGSAEQFCDTEDADYWGEEIVKG